MRGLIGTPEALVAVKDHRPGLTDKQALEVLNHLRRSGRIVNYGGIRRGQARYAVRELYEALESG